MPEDPFAPYRQETPDGRQYLAGFPTYPSNFSRDSFITGLIAGHEDILLTQLRVAARYQGTKYNPHNGEKPGKIHHEMPGKTVPLRGSLLTTYDGCDTTALFIIAIEAMSEINPKHAEDFVAAHKGNIDKALTYILESVDRDSLFWEWPPNGTRSYALAVTYWKDFVLPLPRSAHKWEPHYPVTYALAHFMAARAVESAGKLFKEPAFLERSDAMFQAGITNFIQEDNFMVYRDGDGELHQASSDEMHALAYIPSRYSSLLPLEAIKKRAREDLWTPHGYVCTAFKVAHHMLRKTHADKIWPMDQAFIHYGSTKFGLTDEADIAANIAPHIDTGWELFGVHTNSDGTTDLTGESNPNQMWSIGAKEYFAGRSNLHENPWL